jgi:hypothetical protein
MDTMKCPSASRPKGMMIKNGHSLSADRQASDLNLRLLTDEMAIKILCTQRNDNLAIPCLRAGMPDYGMQACDY